MESEKKYVHICEVCNRKQILIPEDAFNEGWDYPPKMGAFGIISPRTCGSCTIDGTLWWALMCEKKTMEQLTLQQKETLQRITSEPESVTP